MAYIASRGFVEVYNQNTSAYVPLPLKHVSYENYKVTPAQRIDLDSYTSETGELIRNVLSHTRSKIEFETPYINSAQWNQVITIIKNGYISTKERKIKLRYYSPEVDDYREGYFYRPDIEYTVRNVDKNTGVINYDSIRVAFIEY